MIEEPERYAEAFRDAGADILSIHIEACRHLHRNIQQIKELGMIAGVAINPHTPVQLLQDILPDIGIVLIMSVNPGFGGQAFIPHSLHKIKMLREQIKQSGADVKISVDGGITIANAASIMEAGADILVIGSSIFKSTHPKNAISQLKNITSMA